MFRSDSLLDHGRSRDKANRLPALLQWSPNSCRCGRAHSGTASKGHAVFESHFLSVAAALLRTLSDTNSRVKTGVWTTVKNETGRHRDSCVLSIQRSDLAPCRFLICGRIIEQIVRSRRHLSWRKWWRIWNSPPTRLKAKHAGQIHYVHLGKMAVVEPSTQNKALGDVPAEPRRTREASNTSTASCVIRSTISYWRQ